MIPVVGLDPSLRATGLALPDGELLTITTPSCSTLDDRIERIRHVVGKVGVRARIGALVVIEGPAFGMNNKATHELAGLWWALVVRLAEQGNQIAVLSPGQLKKFATGSGRASKPDHRTPRNAKEVWMRLLDRKRLARLMAIQGVSQRELARAAGWSSHSYLGRLLRGEVATLETEPAVRIARALSVGVDDLFMVGMSNDPLRSGKQGAA